MSFAVLNNIVPEHTIKTLRFFFHSDREPDMMIIRVSVQPREPISTEFGGANWGYFRPCVISNRNIIMLPVKATAKETNNSVTHLAEAVNVTWG
jgi:hypothetical protein